VVRALHRPVLAIGLTLLCLAAPDESRADTTGSLRLSLGLGADSNVTRDYREAGTDADGMLLAVLGLQGRYLGERLSLGASYEGGARVFTTLLGEHYLAQGAAADASVAFSQEWTVGLEARVKDRRGGDHSYSDLWGGGFLEFVPDEQLELRVYGAGHRFVYWPFMGYSFGAPEGGATVRYRFNARHSVSVFGEYGARNYAQWARPRCLEGETCPTPTARRRDASFIAGAGYAYRGPITFSATYSFWELSSNSYGEAQQRHRWVLNAGFRLPWRWMLFSQLAVQLARYPDGVFLSLDETLIEDNEATNSVSLRLVRPLWRALDFEAHYGLYLNRLPLNNRTYVRHVGWMGFTLRF
jgi:hypothetical protein